MDDTQILLSYVEQNIADQLGTKRLGVEYYYFSLPLAAIDAVFSAQAQYPTVQNVIRRFCSKYELTIFRSKTDCLPPQERQESVSALLQKIRQNGIAHFVGQVFVNHSVTSGRLKAEILFELLETLEKLKIQTFQDIQAWLIQPDQQRNLISSITAIHGIGEATYRYFLMLAGDERMVKPDTMILRFIKKALGRTVHEAEAVSLIQCVSKQLLPRYPDLNPRLLDYLIWSWQRDQQLVSTPSLNLKKKNTETRELEPKQNECNEPLRNDVSSMSLVGHLPRKGDVFVGKIYDLSLWDSGGWKRRDIRFFKHEINRKECFVYPRPGNSITLIDTDGSRYELKFSNPDSTEKICLGMPSRLKSWYEKKGFDSQIVNSDDMIYFKYSGVGTEFYILTERDYFSWTS